jgi:hypothetical protein
MATDKGEIVMKAGTEISHAEGYGSSGLYDKDLSEVFLKAK